MSHVGSDFGAVVGVGPDRGLQRGRETGSGVDFSLQITNSAATTMSRKMVLQSASAFIGGRGGSGLHPHAVASGGRGVGVGRSHHCRRSRSGSNRRFSGMTGEGDRPALSPVTQA